MPIIQGTTLQSEILRLIDRYHELSSSTICDMLTTKKVKHTSGGVSGLLKKMIDEELLMYSKEVGPRSGHIYMRNIKRKTIKIKFKLPNVTDFNY